MVMVIVAAVVVHASETVVFFSPCWCWYFVFVVDVHDVGVVS